MENLLDRKALLSKEKLEIVKVDLGGDRIIYVKQMTGTERDRFEKSLLKEKMDKKGVIVGFEQATDNFRAKLAVCTACDAEGNLLLNPEDAERLGQVMNAYTLEKIVNAAQKLNAISAEDKEELVKNSVTAQDDNSSSGSASK